MFPSVYSYNTQQHLTLEFFVVTNTLLFLNAIQAGKLSPPQFLKKKYTASSAMYVSYICSLHRKNVVKTRVAARLHEDAALIPSNGAELTQKLQAIFLTLQTYAKKHICC